MTFLFSTVLLLAAMGARLIQREFLKMSEIKDMVSREVEGMAMQPDFFLASNIFYNICENKMKPVLSALFIEDEENLYFCKLIENSLPTYFLPVFLVSQSKNNKLVERIILMFFHIFSELSFDVDRIRIPKIFHKSVSVLYKLRNHFDFEGSFFENILNEYLPNDSREASNAKFNAAVSKFYDFAVYRLLEVTKPYLYSNSRLFLFTLFEILETPFEAVTLFINDLEYMKEAFKIRFHSRRLYLMDSLDNLALKSLNAFKKNRTEEALEKHDKDLITGLVNSTNVGPSDTNVHFIEHGKPITEDYLITTEKVTQPKFEVETGFNYKLLNNCVKNSNFISQSLEKLYCYEITSNVREDTHLYENPKYNELLGEIFQDNSKKYAESFVSMQASYFVEESQYEDGIFPRFKAVLNEATLDFRKKLNDLRRKFYSDHFQSIKSNFEYFFRTLLVKFLSSVVYTANVKPQSLYTNILNFYEFVDDNWSSRHESEFLKLNEFYALFVSKYNKNLEQFSKYS